MIYQTKPGQSFLPLLFCRISKFFLSPSADFFFDGQQKNRSVITAGFFQKS
jgi:hypothetical protein